MKLSEQIENAKGLGPRAVEFAGDVWLELRKVHWPSRKETYAATVIVLTVTVVAALFLGLVDLGLTYLMRAILS